MKKTILIMIVMLLSITSFSQIEYIGKRITDVQYDNGVFHNDTLVVFDSDTTCSNFITINDTIVSILRVLPISQLEVVIEGLTTMVQYKDEYFFEYDEGVYSASIIMLDNINYFGLYLGRIE